MNKKLVGAAALLALVGCAPVVTRYVDQKDPSIIMAECVQPPRGGWFGGNPFTYTEAMNEYAECKSIAERAGHRRLP